MPDLRSRIARYIAWSLALVGAACAGTDTVEPAGDESITSALETLTTHYIPQYIPPQSFDDLIAGHELVVRGTIVAIAPGRKEPLAKGCPAELPPDTVCNDSADESLYKTYINVEVEPGEFMGDVELERPEAPVSFELPWPVDQPVSRSEYSALIGLPVIVLGHPVMEAAAAQAPLEEQGLARAEDVAPNLFDGGPFGLVVGVDGSVHLPLLPGNEEARTLVTGSAEDLDAVWTRVLDTQNGG